MEIRIVKKANIQTPKPLTLRQEKVVAMVGNGGKSKASMLRDAGYSPAVVNNPKKVFDSPVIKKAIDPIISAMKTQQTRALERMNETVDKASYASVAMAVSMLTKDIELLQGRPTVREEFELPEEEKVRIRKLLKKNS